MGARRLIFSWQFVVLLLLALCVRVAWVHHTASTTLTSDAADYDRHGRSIADGHGFPPSGIADGPSAYRPPGYPYFLAAIYRVTGRGWPTARYVECFTGTLTVALIGLIAFQFWDRRLALLATAIAAIFPPMVNISTAVLSEALFVPLVLGATLAVLRARVSNRSSRWVALAGVLVGLAWLTRGNGFLLLLPLGLALWDRTQGWRGLARPAVLVALSLVVISPWTIRNAVVVHRFVPVTNSGGITLAGTYNPTSAHFKWKATWIPPTDDPRLFKYVRQKLDPNYKGPRYTEMQLADKLGAEGKHYLIHHPLYVGTVVFENLKRWLRVTGDPWVAVDAEEPRMAGPLRDYTVWVLVLLAVVGVFSRWRREVPLFVWGVPLMLTTTIFVSGWLRMRAPVDPFLVLLAAAGIAQLLDRSPITAASPSSR